MLEPHTAEARSILDDERQCDVSISVRVCEIVCDLAGGARFLNFTATAIQKRLNYNPSDFSEQRVQFFWTFGQGE